MNRSKWVRATAMLSAGFAAGVLAVIACDGGPDAAGAQGECGTCTVPGPIALSGPVTVIPRQCAQWEVRVQRLANLKPAITESADSYLATASAPENWEPLGSATGSWNDAVMFRRCARWE